jgi:hypothetical protein
MAKNFSLARNPIKKQKFLTAAGPPSPLIKQKIPTATAPSPSIKQKIPTAAAPPSPSIKQKIPTATAPSPPR